MLEIAQFVNFGPRQNGRFRPIGGHSTVGHRDAALAAGFRRNDPRLRPAAPARACRLVADRGKVMGTVACGRRSKAAALSSPYDPPIHADASRRQVAAEEAAVEAQPRQRRSVQGEDRRRHGKAQDRTPRQPDRRNRPRSNAAEVPPGRMPGRPIPQGSATRRSAAAGGRRERHCHRSDTKNSHKTGNQNAVHRAFQCLPAASSVMLAHACPRPPVRQAGIGGDD